MRTEILKIRKIPIERQNVRAHPPDALPAAGPCTSPATLSILHRNVASSFRKSTGKLAGPKRSFLAFICASSRPSADPTTDRNTWHRDRLPQIHDGPPSPLLQETSPSPRCGHKLRSMIEPASQRGISSIQSGPTQLAQSRNQCRSRKETTAANFHTDFSRVESPVAGLSRFHRILSPARERKLRNACRQLEARRRMIVRCIKAQRGMRRKYYSAGRCNSQTSGRDGSALFPSGHYCPSIGRSGSFRTSNEQ